MKTLIEATLLLALFAVVAWLWATGMAQAFGQYMEGWVR